MTSQAAPRFGVNYVPSKNWWHSWVDWDADSMAQDLAAIARLNMDHVRIHCLWPVFQPNAGWISPTAIARLRELLDIAGDYGLDVSISVLDGWLSGFNFMPAWKKGRNMFADQSMIAAEKLLFRALADACGDHPRFMGFDLGNELGVVGLVSDPAPTAVMDAWQSEMLAYCASIAPGKLHVNGVDHNHWFRNVGFSRTALAQTGSLTSLHTWVYFTGMLSHFGPESEKVAHLLDYNIELARAYHNDPGRLVWIQEVGVSPEWLPAAQLPDFAEAAVRNTLDCQGVWGITWWCSHDIAPRFTEFDSLEYGLGLLDCENNVKPFGNRLASVITDFKANPLMPAVRNEALVMREAAFADEPQLWAFIRRYMRLVEEGIRPAIVREAKADDAIYLAARGIDRLIQ
jgi:hypothetical protein